MPTMRVIVFIGVLAAVGTVRAETWTNQAGRVIEARLGECDGVWVTLIRTNASPLRLPLSALREADQRRARVKRAQSIAPSFVTAAHRDAAAVMERFERLPDDRRTAESREKALNMACTIFDARIDARSAELREPDVWNEVKRKRASLVNRVK